MNSTQNGVDIVKVDHGELRRRMHPRAVCERVEHESADFLLEQIPDLMRGLGAAAARTDHVRQLRTERHTEMFELEQSPIVLLIRARIVRFKFAIERMWPCPRQITLH